MASLFCIIVMMKCFTACVILAGSLLLPPVHSHDSVCDKNSKCLSDGLGFEAVKQLHDLIDDDHNGNLDRTESDEFFRDELKHEDGAARQATFHGSDDLISIIDLWELWTVSEVYNWTVEEVIKWLEEDVGLPKYAENFRLNDVDGHILPRIAVNSQYVTNILKIKNPVHRQKLSVKATDLVLFGYNKRGHNWLKDIILVTVVFVALFLAWLARRDNKASQAHIRKVMLELENLQQSEDTLHQLQKDYDETKREHLETALAKQRLEKKLEMEANAAKEEAERLRTTRETTAEEISRLKLAELELIEVRKALAEAERRIDQMTREIPQLVNLQQWLQLTYEIESQYYVMKRESAENHLRVAREMCERIRKKRGGLLGSLRVAHSTSLDDTDHSIMQARGALEEVRLHFQERNQRWLELEAICGFNIIQNPGLHVLETTLRGVGGTYLTGATLPKSTSMTSFNTSQVQPVEGELDEDLTSSQIATVRPVAIKWLKRISHHKSEKRRSLVEAFGPGSRSLGLHSRTVPHSLCKPETPLNLVLDDNVSATTNTEQVKFGLGDIKSKIEDNNSVSKSKRLEPSVTMRPSLPTSLSESNLHNISGNGSASTTQRRSLKSSDNPSLIVEESNHGSSESLTNSPNEKEKSTKKSSIKTLFKSKKKKDL